MRRTVKTISAGAAVLGSVILGSGTAVAAPQWQSVGKITSCEKSVAHTAVGGVNFQGCLVVSELGRAQVVLVVNNHSGRAVTVSGAITSDFGDASCEQMTLSSGTQRACYGPTAAVPDCYDWGAGATGGPYGGTVRFTVNGVTNEAKSSTVCLNWVDFPG
ncbi:hypothetical protein [Streptomyces sp. A012304]|uniref:hypothetical protein n=1 Tax=Streptomyces sp. A012304 TaxID=375446 RepID=UPI00222ED8C8|nr:hypothetical protein [Streptomyces sp. A012304]